MAQESRTHRECRGDELEGVVGGTGGSNFAFGKIIWSPETQTVEFGGIGALSGSTT